MTFPIKKRIDTELCIDGNKGLYIHNVGKETDQENILIRKNGSRKITDLLKERIPHTSCNLFTYMLKAAVVILVVRNSTVHN